MLPKSDFCLCPPPFPTSSLLLIAPWFGGNLHPSPFGQNLLEVEVTHPVNNIEEQERSGEENPRVGVQFQDVYVHSAPPPGATLTLLVAAEETLAILAIQALVEAGLLELLPVHGVVQRDDRRGRCHVQHRVILEGRSYK